MWPTLGSRTAKEHNNNLGSIGGTVVELSAKSAEAWPPKEEEE